MIDTYATHCCAADKNHTMRHYLSLPAEGKNEYVNVFTSMVNIVCCLSFLVITARACDPPAALRKDDLMFGNTYIRNDYCVDHPSVSALCSIMYFLGYITYDSIFMAATFTESTTGR